MKRSNRLVLLIGVFLAIVAFFGIVFVFQTGQGGGGGGPTPPPSELPTVYAKVNIPLGTEITADQAPNLFEVKQVKVAERDPSSIASIDLTIGKTVREDVKTGEVITSAVFSLGRQGVTHIDTPVGFRAIALQVDQVSGVGTLINKGDYVDVLVGITGDRFPVITVDPQSNQITPVPGLNGTSVKLLLQGIQVIGTLLPPPPAQAQGQQAPQPSEQPTNLTGQQEIVILAVTPQQSEVVKFVQMDGTVTLVLRAAKEFRDPNDPTKPFLPAPDDTTGVILKTLVTDYGVLPPELVETVLPTQKKP